MSDRTASLVIAIVFHQLFEGLSLGIRIAGLPSKHSEGTLPGPLALPRHTHPFLLRRLQTPIGTHAQTAPRRHLRHHDPPRHRHRARRARRRLLHRTCVFPPPPTLPSYLRPIPILTLLSSCSAPDAHPGHHVRDLGRDAHLRGVRGDARGRLRDGRAPVAQQRAQAGARARESACGRGCYGCDWIVSLLGVVLGVVWMLMIWVVWTRDGMDDTCHCD